MDHAIVAGAIRWRGGQGASESVAAAISDAQWPPAGPFLGRDPASIGS
jgi:hypothetical protein